MYHYSDKKKKLNHIFLFNSTLVKNKPSRDKDFVKSFKILYR